MNNWYFHDLQWTMPHPVFYIRTSSHLHIHTLFCTHSLSSTHHLISLDFPPRGLVEMTWNHLLLPGLVQLLPLTAPSAELTSSSQPLQALCSGALSAQHTLRFRNYMLALNPWWELELTVFWKTNTICPFSPGPLCLPPIELLQWISMLVTIYWTKFYILQCWFFSFLIPSLLWLWDQRAKEQF